MNLDALAILVGSILLGVSFIAGGKKGVVTYLLFIFMIWTWASIQDGINRKDFYGTESLESEICYSKATAAGVPLSVPPEHIVVRMDNPLFLGSSGKLSAPTKKNPSNIEFVSVLPSERQEGVIYIDISSKQEPISEANKKIVTWLNTSVSDSHGQIIASLIDIERGNPDWCLGEPPPDSLEHFLSNLLGKPLGLSNTLSLPVLSPKGTTTQVENGRYFESFHQGAEFNDEIKSKLSLLPPTADCHYIRSYSDDLAVCRPDSPEKNEIYLNKLSTVFDNKTTWFAFMNDHPNEGSRFDSLRILERSPNGTLLKIWHVRFPMMDSQGRPVVLRNIRLEGRKLTAEALFSYKSEANSSSSTLQEGTRSWYQHRFMISADLVN